VILFGFISKINSYSLNILNKQFHTASYNKRNRQGVYYAKRKTKKIGAVGCIRNETISRNLEFNQRND
jgi:hypothetical protein